MPCICTSAAAVASLLLGFSDVAVNIPRIAFVNVALSGTSACCVLGCDYIVAKK